MINKADEALAKYELERAAKHDEVVGHKATPYQVSGCMAGTKSIIVHGDENTFDPIIAEVCDAATAAFIVRACNEHAALKRKMNGLVLLAELIKKLDDKDGLSSTALGYLRDKAIAALAAAGVQS